MFGIGNVGAVEVFSGAAALSSTGEGRGVWPRCLVSSKVAAREATISIAGAGAGVRVGTTTFPICGRGSAAR